MSASTDVGAVCFAVHQAKKPLHQSVQWLF